jgi:hypothetical protein
MFQPVFIDLADKLTYRFVFVVMDLFSHAKSIDQDAKLRHLP